MENIHQYNDRVMAEVKAITNAAGLQELVEKSLEARKVLKKKVHRLWVDWVGDKKMYGPKWATAQAEKVIGLWAEVEALNQSLSSAIEKILAEAENISPYGPVRGLGLYGSISPSDCWSLWTGPDYGPDPIKPKEYAKRWILSECAPLGWWEEGSDGKLTVRLTQEICDYAGVEFPFTALPPTP